MVRGAAESILHGLVGALAIAAILGVGRIRSPQTRLRFWLLAASFPALLAPLFGLLLPLRQSEHFRDHWALFSGERLSLLAWKGIPAGTACAALFALAGLLLYLRDLIPFLVDVAGNWTRTQETAALPSPLEKSVAAAAAALGMAAPRVLVLATRHPVLACRHWRRPLIVASIGVMDLLAADELDAAIVHEMTHAKEHDPAWGWVLMMARGLFFFNPSLQLCLRAAAHEVERRADERAAAVVGPDPLSRSLRKLANAGSDDGRTLYLPVWRRFRLLAIAHRCQSLPKVGPTPPGWILAASAVGLGVVLFFTVA